MSEEHEENAILFMFAGIVLSALTSHVLSNHLNDCLPYTVVIFIEGIIMAGLNKKDLLGTTFGDSVSQWENIEADLILYVFLPALLFGEAMSLNWYQVKGGFPQSLLLAGPGVVIGAFLMGTIIYYVMDLGWTWNEAMIFGAITSATDPVAVVALLKGAGASPQLTITIIGESLMNDGTAMVLFMLFYNMMEGTTYDVLGVFYFFMSMSFGSVLLGVVMGLITVRMLRNLNRTLVEEDKTLQIALTFCCAYLSFFVAQHLLDISGVLCCCAAGVMLAWLAPPLILSHESMHNVWSTIEWLGNSLIFLLAGLIFGDRTLESVGGMDYVYLLCIFSILMAIRLFIVVTFFPILCRIGHKCTFNDALFMVWGGLRGALGIVLALIVEINHEDLGLSKYESDRLFFYVGGIATLTLVINATTSEWVLNYLGLIGGENKDKNLIMRQIRKRMRAKMKHVVDNLTTTLNLTEEHLEELRATCSIFNTDQPGGRDSTNSRSSKSKEHLFDPSRSVLPDLGSLIKSVQALAQNKAADQDDSKPGSSNLSYKTEEDDNATGAPLLHAELLSYIRTIFLEIVRVRYWHHIHDGKLPRLSFSSQFLLYSIDVGLNTVNDTDDANRRANCTYDWLCIKQEIDTNERWLLALLAFFDRIVPSGVTYFKYLFGWVRARRDKRVVYMLTSFIDAHQHAQKKIHDFVGDADTDVMIPEEMTVITESKASVAAAKQVLNDMNADQVRGIVNKQAIRNVLAKQTAFVDEMVKEGLLTSKDSKPFYNEIEKDLQNLEASRNKLYREQSKKAGDVLRNTMTGSDHRLTGTVQDLSLHSRLLEASYHDDSATISALLDEDD